MNRFETQVVVMKENLEELERLNEEWLKLAMTHTKHQWIILDKDSSDRPVYGEREGAAYNSHAVAYHGAVYQEWPTQVLPWGC